MWKTQSPQRESKPVEARRDDIAVAAFSTVRTVASRAQLSWLRRGLGAPGGKLPLFDRAGQDMPRRIIRGCIEAGWAEPWFSNPLKPDWLVCRLTEEGRALVARAERIR